MEKKLLYKFLSILLLFISSVICFSQTKKDTIKEKAIDEVVITTIKKGITNERDKTVLNIDSNPIYNNLTLKDALEYMPKISIEDGSISVLGKKNVLILVNGRESSLSISNIPVSKAKKIELISNASSMYDSKYDAVINIVLDKWKNQGLSGNFLYNTTVANKQVSNFGSNNLTYNKNKFSTILNYSFNHDNKILKDDAFQELENYNYNLLSTTLASRKVNYFGISSNYEINDNQNIGIDFSYTNIYNDVPGTVEQTFFNKNNIDSSLISSKTRKDFENDFAGSLYHNLKNKKISLDSYLYYYYSKNNSKRDFRSSSENQEVFNIYNINNNISKNFIANVSGGYSFEDGSNLKFGLRAVNSLGTSNQNISTNSTELTFDFNETVYAQYLEWNKKINKIDLKIGNRLEYFIRDVKYNLEVNQQQNNLDFFPSLYAGYQFNKKNTISFSASKKIDRVPFNNILPYFYYTSFNEIIKGNPNLQNQIRYNIELNYVYNNILYITPFYSYNKNNIENITFVDGNLINYIPQNYDSYSWGINSTYAKSLNKWWYINVKLNLQNNKNKGNILGVTFDNNNLELSSILSNVFNFKSLGSFIIQNSYYTPSYYDLYKVSQGFKTDIKYTAKFLNEKLVFSLTVRDVLGTYFNKVEAINQKYFSLNKKDYSWQQVVLGLTYNFDKGKEIKKNNKKIDTSENERLKNE
ncbi:outer membrane beta-barrel protein [Chryseobacterium fluminis]|uniref:outer membrane beta-barrel protein n=1 Tax=Chryseobacterium fluminis TaxID=2983606 RepID=UPI00224D0C4C|nr:outer membrane beta-barrel protein [Chryseobacterium sp. MMS21-Ot14]UZT99975.1 outer membrane beta-barrel protein [Chryseobacterium sp. MMS21-Ot14]